MPLTAIPILPCVFVLLQKHLVFYFLSAFARSPSFRGVSWLQHGHLWCAACQNWGALAGCLVLLKRFDPLIRSWNWKGGTQDLELETLHLCWWKNNPQWVLPVTSLQVHGIHVYGDTRRVYTLCVYIYTQYTPSTANGCRMLSCKLKHRTWVWTLIYLLGTATGKVNEQQHLSEKRSFLCWILCPVRLHGGFGTAIFMLLFWDTVTGELRGLTGAFVPSAGSTGLVLDLKGLQILDLQSVFRFLQVICQTDKLWDAGVRAVSSRMGPLHRPRCISAASLIYSGSHCFCFNWVGEYPGNWEM